MIGFNGRSEVRDQVKPEQIAWSLLQAATARAAEVVAPRTIAGAAA